MVLKVGPRLNLLHLLLPEHAELLLVVLVDLVRLHVVRLQLRLLQLSRASLLLPLLLRVGIAGVGRALGKLTVGLAVDHGHPRGGTAVCAGGTALAALAASLLLHDVRRGRELGIVRGGRARVEQPRERIHLSRDGRRGRERRWMRERRRERVSRRGQAKWEGRGGSAG